MRDDAMAAAEVEGEGAWATVIGENRLVERVGVDWAVGGVKGVGEGGFAGRGSGWCDWGSGVDG